MEAHQYMVKLAFEAMKVTAVLNQGYHEPEEIFVITKLYPNQFEVLPKSWTKVMRQSHFEFCIGQDLTHSIFL